MRNMLALALVSLLLPGPMLLAREAPLAPLAVPPSGVLGVTDAELDPTFWVQRAPNADRVLMNRAAIEAQNQRVLTRDSSMHDLAALPDELPAAQVRGWIEALSQRPTRTRYDLAGKPIAASVLDGFVADLALDRVPASQPTRFGLLVRRADLRTFPTALRVFSAAGDTDIDRFQESGIFPGTPVVVAHTSRDGQWLFVISPRYAAWVEKDAVAIGPRDTVLTYRRRAPYRVITGDDVATVFTREVPALSELALDMGVRVPLAQGLAANAPVNGQSTYAAWTVDLPVRNADGTLAIEPALLQKNKDTADDYLPLTRANIITQAFKFLGERYGWGHAYDGRDCSGFVSDVYASLGLLMPRNTSAQAVSPALEHETFDANSTAAERAAAIATLDVGDLVYIPGHVVMVIGKAHGRHYVINDVGGTSYVLPDGTHHHVKLNSVAVMPLEPQMFNATDTYIQRMTSIVRIHGQARP